MFSIKKILISVFAFSFVLAVPVQAQYASGGTGLHKPRIFWMNWGAAGTNVYNGATINRTYSVGGYVFSATCVLSNSTTVGGGTTPLTAYTPGSWQGDGFDELYNIGGNQPGTGANPNTLNVGLLVNNKTVEFDVSCTATFDGQPFALKGLAFSDVEASGGAEYVAARLTSGGTMRIIDQINQCYTGASPVAGVVNTTVGGFPEVRFTAPTVGTSCENNPTPALRGGPSLVGYLDGASQARFTVSGGGGSAIAIGLIAQFDYSEAIPASYGVAVHQFEQSFTGGVATAGVNYSNTANLATLQTSTRLGPTILPDGGVIQAVGFTDTDALPKTTGPLGNGYANIPLPSPTIPGTSTYTISNVVCDGGVSSIAGWIDFDGNGTFDVDERSAIVTCPGGLSSVNLTWTLPADYKPQQTSYMRLRSVLNTAFLATATGIANNGEVEDYRLQLPGISNLAITKTNTPGINGEVDQASDTVQSGSSTIYTLTARNNGPTAADGAVVADPALAGLNCTTAPTCVASGGAVCPTSPTVAQLQAGVAIPTLPLNGSVVFTLTCTVTATGF